jgi:hypothetical protein
MIGFIIYEGEVNKYHDMAFFIGIIFKGEASIKTIGHVAKALFTI